MTAANRPPQRLVIPFGYDKVGFGYTFTEVEGELKPAVCIFPRSPDIVGKAGEPYPVELDSPPDGSVILAFKGPEEGHALIKMILDSLVQTIAPETPAND